MNSEIYIGVFFLIILKSILFFLPFFKPMGFFSN